MLNCLLFPFSRNNSMDKLFLLKEFKVFSSAVVSHYTGTNSTTLPEKLIYQCSTIYRIVKW